MRSIWNGSISFGLVTIPVKLYSAVEDARIDLDMLDRRDLARIRYKRVNEDTGEEVEWGDIVKGFKNDDDRYIVLEDDDFEKASLKKSKTIDIEEFVESDEVADVLFKTPYYLEPQKEGGKAYNLLRDALAKTGRMGVATFVMRQKEHLCLLGVYEGVLVLYVIRFGEEIRKVDELKLPSSKVTPKELQMAVSLIDQYSSSFKLSKYKDSYNKELMRIIKAKSAGKKPKVAKFESKPTGSKDLLAKLKESLERKKGKAA